MELKKHKEEFDKIISKYNLSDHDKAEKLATFLTDSKLFKMKLKKLQFF